ncbi:diguanylate cyclase [soil metagenome]
MTDTTSHLLMGRGLFQDVEPDVLGKYLPQTDRYDLDAGAILLAPGRRSRYVYIVLSGNLHVHSGSIEEPPVATLGPGACAGEASLLEAIEPAGWITAGEQTHLMVLSHEVLWSLVNASHEFARNLLEALSHRTPPAREPLAPTLGKPRRIALDNSTDALTEVHNRHWLDDMFRRHIERSLQSKSAVSLVMIDIGGFKAYNDRYGHLAGDKALRFVADSLRRHFRPTDMIARFGGDEFAVLLPDTRGETAAAIAERLQDGFRRDCAAAEPDQLKAPVTLAIGIAELRTDDTLGTLIERAEHQATSEADLHA